MTKEVGLWIDHKRAVIVILSEGGEKIQQIDSGVAKHTRYHGATHPKSPYSAQYEKGDNQLDRQLMEQLNKFYGTVITQIRGADSLLILGPGEAKHELQKRLAQEKAGVKATAIETADKMTDRQLTARVRKYYKELRKHA